MSDAELIRQLRLEADANAAEVRRLARERDIFEGLTDANRICDDRFNLLILAQEEIDQASRERRRSAARTWYNKSCIG
jgi:hypothetical protein